MFASEEMKLSYAVVSNMNVSNEVFFFCFVVQLRNGNIANGPPSKKPFGEVC